MPLGGRPRAQLAECLGPPAPRPCESCPYRADVPSGIWAADEYEKLPRYDRETGEQPMNIFQCHQQDADSAHSRICAGWAGCHGEELLALRMAVRTRQISPETYEAAVRYSSPVELFATGEEAARHGQAEIEMPGQAARTLVSKISRRRTDLKRAGRT
ncbi:DUF6283 family protein [Mycobacteroides abscessus]|uniref:DUF6283 family protein n=1 Tax=Mycobacteroides abscessus TaxID=36809 RepID=UPI00092CA31D|nr:DUF6283 family protein [Mycobacteroides abscessus]SHQ45677.1 Uncharacterised protein [Mycobacteroides abscessus subsp. abscessus]SKQ87503.1 Uncharacterised protein [Mycobacteroides abscessus subsp. massiliense]SLC51868.1 Uncharacterised protein [Mycobacteroides abscessus subsp. massiliense]